MKRTCKYLCCLIAIVGVQFFALGRFAIGGDRRIHIGADMPQFSAVDVADLSDRWLAGSFGFDDARIGPVFDDLFARLDCQKLRLVPVAVDESLYQ